MTQWQRPPLGIGVFIGQAPSDVVQKRAIWGGTFCAGAAGSRKPRWVLPVA